MPDALDHKLSNRHGNFDPGETLDKSSVTGRDYR